MSMATHRGDKTCDLCGEAFESDELLAVHLATDHGGLRGDQPGGTGGAASETGSGPSGTTTSGSRGTDTRLDADSGNTRSD